MKGVRARVDVHLVCNSKDRLEAYALLACVRMYARQWGTGLLEIQNTRTTRTNEPTRVLFTCFGARANVAYRPDILGRETELVTLKNDEAVLDSKAQCGGDAIFILVVICILYELE